MSSRAQTVTTVALVGLALALGGYVLVVDKDKPTSSEIEARKANLLKVYRREQISRIDVQVGSDKARITRVGPDAAESEYRIEILASAAGAYPEQPADQGAVERLLQAFEFASPIRPIDEANPPPTGLDRPRATIELTMGGLSWKLSLGAEAASPSGAAYASVSGQGTFVIARDLVSDLLRPVDSYRSRTIVPYGVSDIGAMRIGGQSLVRAPWGGFRVEGGPRASRTAVDHLTGALASLHASSFAPLTTAQGALAAAKQAGVSLSIVVEPTDKSRPIIRLETAGPCSPVADGGAADAGAGAQMTLVIRTEPQWLAACVPAETAEGLRIKPEALADRRVFDLKPDDVEELKIERGDKVLELARKGSGWKMRRPDDRDVPATDAKGFIDSLAKVEGELATGVDPRSVGLEPARGTARILQPASGSQTHPEQRIEIGEEKDGFLLLRRAVDGAILRVSKDSARLLDASASSIRSTDLLDIAPEQIRKTAVSWEGGRQVLLRGPAGFKLETPAGYVADGSLSADLFEALAKLSAERWVADRDDGSFGLGTPRLTAQFEAAQDGGTATWKLQVGARSGDGAYARLESEPGVFILSRNVEQALSTWVIDRSAFILDPAEVQTMALTGGGKTVSIKGDKGQWQVPGGGLSDAAVEKVRDAFLQMRAEAAVHTGAAQENEGLATPLLEVVVHRAPGHEQRSSDIRIRIGRGDVWRTMNVYWARREGIDATYAVAASRVKPVLSAMGLE
jgi:hypothetical protein